MAVKKDWLVHVWLILGYFIGILYVMQGFLLTRHEIADKSPVGETISPAKYSRVVVLVIDAFRYDFAVYDPSLAKGYYANQMKTMKKLLDSRPQHAALFKFIADPPTTTLQRLKGLTTGSLPTFVDVGNNFAGDELLEDNLLHQFNQSGLHAVFMGDDTWASIFPKSFLRLYPFPSFDVWDLDTVDNGVRSILPREISATDWGALVLHCLGVDHCGHRYGPNHPMMQRKLEEMDQLISYLVDRLADDNLLVVMGDHGMTVSGDHGGESADELAAALFVFSPHFKLHTSDKIKSTAISQIDLVPTLALLTGSAIPYSSLGTVILDLLTPDHLLNSSSISSDDDELITSAYHFEARFLNSFQIWRYLQKYSRIGTLPVEQFSLLQKKYRALDSLNSKVKSDLLKCGQGESPAYRTCIDNLTCCRAVKTDLEAFIDKSNEFLHAAKEMCRSVWARFDLVPIYCGFAIVFIFLLFNLSLVNRVENSLFQVKLNRIVFGILVTSLALINARQQLISPVLASILVIAGIGSSIGKPSWMDYMYRRTKFCTQRDLLNILVLLFSLALFTSNSFVIQEPYVVHFLVQSLLWTNFRKGFPIKLVFSLSLRLGLPYFRCREEQFPHCIPHNLYRSIPSVAAAEFPRRFSLAFLCLLLIFPVFVLLKTKKTKILTAAGFSLALLSHWLLQGVEHWHSGTVPGSFQNALPRIVYFSSLALISRSVISYLRARSPDLETLCVVAAMLLSVIAAMLAGDGLLPPLMLMCWNVVLCAALCRQDRFHWGKVLFYCLLSVHGFFSTGHHTSLANIPWETAFVGFSHASSQSTSSNILPAVLVSYSTSFSFVLHAVCLIPVFITNRTKVLTHPDADMENSSVVKTWTLYLLFHALRIFGCMGAAVIHRRHLMVWKIFAPRLLYELLFFAASCLFTLIPLLLKYTKF